MKAFISYSHKDKKYLQKLEIHLAQIKRDNIIQSWTDNKILAGDNLSETINAELSTSDLFIALLSPEYIASNYCYEKEFQFALQMLEKKEIIIIPVICEPCDWHNTPFKNLLALPKDGKPISEWANDNTAYMSINENLRKVAARNTELNINKSNTEFAVEKIGRNYKIQKEFDSIQKLEFVEKSFKEVVRYLSSYLDEITSLENVNVKILKQIETELKFIVVNRNMIQKEATVILEFDKEIDSINQGAVAHFFRGMSDFQIRITINKQSNGFALSNDPYNLFWLSYGINMRDDSKPYTTKEIADAVFEDVLKQVGISFDE